MGKKWAYLQKENFLWSGKITCEEEASIVKCRKMPFEGGLLKSSRSLHVLRSFRNCWIHLVNIWWMFDWLLSQNCRSTLPLNTVDQLVRRAKMSGCCGWQGWNVWKFKPIVRLNIWLHYMVKQGFMCLKQNWKWILARLKINKTLGLTWFKVKFELKLSNQMEKKTK